MELVADVGPGRTAVGGGAVSGPGVPVGGVLVTTVRTDAQDFGFTGRLLRFGHRPVVHQLRFRGLTIEVDSDGVAVESPPGFDVGAVHRDRAGLAELVGHRGLGQGIGEPFGVDTGMAGVEDLSQLGEGPVHPVVGLDRVGPVEPKPVALVVGEGVDDPGHLDQMPSVMP